jgi:hypothetical protein
LISIFLFAGFSWLNVLAQGNATFNVDMSAASLVEGDRVFISGKPWEWAVPGDSADLELLDADADGIFSVTLPVCPNMFKFKFFKNTGWDNGEPISLDRIHTFTEDDETLSFTWGVHTDDVSKNNPLPVMFEGSDDKSWEVFATGPDPFKCSDFSVVPNPSVSGINTSANALQFVVNDNDETWVGALTEAYGTIEFTEDYHTFTMMVYKTIISPTVLKFENSSNGGPVAEVSISNTIVDEWELLTYDFSELIGYSYPTFVIFPDFPETRTAGTTVFLDNIAEAVQTVRVSSNIANSIKVYPNPVTDQLNVTFSSANAKVIIYNSLGRKMEEVNVEGNMTTFDVSNYVSGLYFVKVNNNAIEKFVK